jgi:hypothetical protein
MEGDGMNGLSPDAQYRHDREWRTRINSIGTIQNPERDRFVSLVMMGGARNWLTAKRQEQQDALPMPQLRAKLDDLGRRIEAAKRGG